MTDQILEIAQKRFGMFGLEKTTMKDIASDLGMTKGSLYYYFPDKEHLYIAVVEKEFGEFLHSVKDKMGEIEDPVEMLPAYTRIRLSYFRSFLNLSRFRLEDSSGLNSIMGTFWKNSSALEIAIIRDIFVKGMQKGVFSMEDLNETAALFLDLMTGLRLLVIRKKKLFYLEEEEYEMLINKTEAFTKIFIRGIRATTSPKGGRTLRGER
jgi:AcrR family transcriptional regulator